MPPANECLIKNNMEEAPAAACSFKMCHMILIVNNKQIIEKKKTANQNLLNCVQQQLHCQHPAAAVGAVQSPAFINLSWVFSLPKIVPWRKVQIKDLKLDMKMKSDTLLQWKKW